jgi:hypothetical protein
MGRHCGDPASGRPFSPLGGLIFNSAQGAGAERITPSQPGEMR